MPLQLPPTPNFNVTVPDITGEQLRRAQLSSLLSETSVRQQLAPLQVQEQQQKTQQAGIQTQLSQQELDSRKAMMAVIASGELNKYAGVETPDGSGFDAAGAYQYLISKGVRPDEAGQYANSWLTIGKNQAEISKNLGEAGKAQQEIREKTLKQVANKLGDIGDMSISKAANALDAFRQDLVRNPKAYAGLTQQELAELYAADLTHLDALEGHLGMAAMVADFHKSKAEAAKETGKTDPNSPFYDPSEAYLARRAAAGDQEAQTILGQQTKQAGAKTAADAKARFPYELALKQAELGMQQAFAVNPQTGQRELISAGDAKAKGYTSVTPLGTGSGAEGAIDREVTLNSQLNDLQLNTSRFKVALAKMGTLSQQDVNHMARILSDPEVKSGLTTAVGMGSLLSIVEQGSRAKDWNELSPDKQEALIGALRMKNSALLFQKVSTGMGRASKEAMDIEIANMPAPMEGATVGLKKLQAFQENVDQMATRSVKLPWMETPKDVRTRIEGQR